MEHLGKLRSNEIRVIKLLPGNWSDPIRCESHIVCLSDYHFKYKALSYAWGLAKFSQPIDLNGSPIRISPHLERPLRQLRNDRDSIWLWVDAVCINQSDDEEKTKQVKLMRQIFAQSQEVVLYMGDAIPPSFSESFKTTSSSRAAISHPVTPYQCECASAQNNTKPGYVWRRPSHSGSHLFCFIRLLAEDNYPDCLFLHNSEGQSSLTHVLEALRLFLFAVRWWKRVWVIQEVVVPSKIMVLYGSMIAPWEMFVQAANRLHNDPQMWLRRLVADDLKILAAFSQQIRGIESIRQRWHSTEQITLLQLLRQFSGREATDSRDRVYALLGLAKDGPSIEPIYSISESQAFIDTTLDIISRSEGLDGLAGDLALKNNHALPSWVPDWSSVLHSLVRSRVENVRHYAACGDSTIYVQMEASEEWSGICQQITPCHKKSKKRDDSWDIIDDWIMNFWSSLDSSPWDQLLREYQKDADNRAKYLAAIENFYIVRGGPMCLRHYGDGVISLPGLLIDSVLAVGETMWSDKVLMATIESWLALIAGHSAFLKEAISCEDFERTMCADLLTDTATGRCRRLFQQDIYFIANWIVKEVGDYSQKSLLRPCRLGKNSLENSALVGNLTSVRSSILQATFRRRFFITARGRIGLGPTSMKKGDRVYILPGGRTPFILRPNRRGQARVRQGLDLHRYTIKPRLPQRLLGDCYVHGLMDGEAMDIWRKTVGSFLGYYKRCSKMRDVWYYKLVSEWYGAPQFYNTYECEPDLEDICNAWEHQTAKWHSSAERWNDAYSRLWARLEEPERWPREDNQLTWEAARRDNDRLGHSWEAIKIAWQRNKLVLSEVMLISTAVDWKHTPRKLHSHIQAWNSAVESWGDAKRSLQQSLANCDEEIQCWLESERAVVDQTFENIKRRNDFMERFRLRKSDFVFFEGKTIPRGGSKIDWQSVLQKWQSFVDQDWQQDTPWQDRELIDAQRGVQEAETKLDEIFQARVEAAAHPSEREDDEFHLRRTEWETQINRWRSAAENWRSDSLYKLDEKLKSAEDELQTTLASLHSPDKWLRDVQSSLSELARVKMAREISDSNFGCIERSYVCLI
ncbi:heterokaryon incompatibility protein-domain-containing protein [Aspergillus coremiiformis]|uniref:Heterokaryon incompatibility protein-domain-containing protein n=1 Tax=Aspergillus coremiiformis TaxID=138285 RepID=A0A5N6ZAT4_9EURO|nr:heterokaryon incompatibility protein-domain-containing protein [Aspergillus coremiiformis]